MSHDRTRPRLRIRVGVKTDAVGKAAAVAGEQHGDTRVPVIVERHCGLQRLVHSLFPALQRPPQLSDFRSLAGVQQFRGMEPTAMACSISRPARASADAESAGGPGSGLNRPRARWQLLRADEDVGIVPIDEYPIHVVSLPLWGHTATKSSLATVESTNADATAGGSSSPWSVYDSMKVAATPWRMSRASSGVSPQVLHSAIVLGLFGGVALDVLLIERSPCPIW